MPNGGQHDRGICHDSPVASGSGPLTGHCVPARPGNLWQLRVLLGGYDHRSVPDGAATSAVTGTARSRRWHGAAGRGQALVEFALVIGLFMLVIGGLVQFGIILWSQNAITRVSRDTARWAVTQSASPCDAAASRTSLAGAADQLALGASLVSYSAGTWFSAPPIGSLGAEGVGVDWQSVDSSFPSDCPPSDNATVWMVRVRVNHVVPILLPGLQFIAPACASPGFCLTSTTELRMEPKTP